MFVSLGVQFRESCDAFREHDGVQLLRECMHSRDKVSISSVMSACNRILSLMGVCQYSTMDAFRHASDQCRISLPKIALTFFFKCNLYSNWIENHLTSYFVQQPHCKKHSARQGKMMHVNMCTTKHPLDMYGKRDGMESWRLLEVCALKVLRAARHACMFFRLWSRGRRESRHSARRM